MIDARLRPLIDPPLNALAHRLHHTGISANQVTVAGFVVGMTTVPTLAAGCYTMAAGLILINRLADGLDGAVARDRGITDFGGYLDIVLDFIFYSAVVFGFCLARPEQAVYGAFLIFSFIGTGTSFLAFSVFAAKRSLETTAYGMKSLFFLGGLTEGFETITAFLLMCLFPDQFSLIASLFAVMCWITTFSRIMVSRKLLSGSGSRPGNRENGRRDPG